MLLYLEFFGNLLVFSEFVKATILENERTSLCCFFVMVVFFYPHGCVKVKGRFSLFDALTVYVYI